MRHRFASLSVVFGILAALPGWAGPSVAVRIGYFPNIAHSQALIGLSRGDFAKALGPDVAIAPTVFNAGPSIIEALFAKQIDLAYIGPNPAINGYMKSDGKALRIIAGATSGGAAFIVSSTSGISKASDLEGKTIASPQLGNTQDVALRKYLLDNGLNTVERGGTVKVTPMDNPFILDSLRQGRIQGAWVPEPWASRLELEGNGTVLVDERSRWPKGEFSTALIIVSTDFLAKHPDLVQAWLKVHVAITLWELANPREASALVNAQIARISGKALPSAVLDRAWPRMKPSYDPLSDTILSSAQDAFAIGFLKSKADLKRLFELRPLNRVLDELGQKEVR